MIKWCTHPAFGRTICEAQGGEICPDPVHVGTQGTVPRCFPAKPSAAAFSASAMAQKPRKERAQELVYDGWEALDSSDRPSADTLRWAEEIFSRALAIDPELADAYNGLGSVRYERKRYTEAEAVCRIALEKARVELGTDDAQAFTWWGEPSTRPYMRARHILGLALWRQGKYRDAIAEFQEMLRRNPHDNQGVRYILGPLYHLCGDLRGAVAAYKDASPDPESVGDPTNELSFGLALFQLRRYSAAVFRYRYAFFLNLYLPLVVLSRRVRRLDIWYGSNLAEPENAQEYWENYGVLWRGQAEAKCFLRLVYEDEEVRSELNAFIEVAAELRNEHDLRKRGPLVDEYMKFKNRETIKETNRKIASRVLNRYRPADTEMQ
jgi:tetratricopeptide (TPR) repeat protein